MVEQLLLRAIEDVAVELVALVDLRDRSILQQVQPENLNFCCLRRERARRNHGYPLSEGHETVH